MENPDDPVTPEARHYEQLGFTFCRMATIGLIALAPLYAIPVAAGLTIYFYLRAMQAGVTRSDCFLRHPLVIVGFWLCVGVADVVYLMARFAAGRHGLWGS